MALNRKQTLFAHEYAASFNATDAAKKAGYAEKAAYAQGHQLLKKPEISQLVEKIVDSRKKATCITLESLLTDCEEVKKRCLQREPVLDEEGNPTGEWKFDAANATKAIELQAKLQGLFRERLKLEHEGKLEIVVSDYRTSGEQVEKEAIEVGQVVEVSSRVVPQEVVRSGARLLP